jgi:hypothetical protein
MDAAKPKIDPFETPVWTLYGSDNDAEIIHGCLARFNDKRNLPARMWSDGGTWTSRTGWAATREELIERYGIRPSCSECGKPFATLSWCKPYPELLTERNLCFRCNHYLHDAIPNYGKPGHVVIGSCLYSWDVKRPMVNIRNDGHFYGHGGREFAIRLSDGSLVRTNNLWSGGQVAARFLSRMPDNATFEAIPKPVGHGQGFLG